MKPSPELLDKLWPERHEVADALGLKPEMRTHFIPLQSSLTPEQRDVIFPPARRIPALRDLVKAVEAQKESS